MDSPRLIEKKDDNKNLFQVVVIPFVPLKVSISDLKPNKKLLDDNDIKMATEKLKEEKDGRYSKKIVNLPFGIIKLEGELYAVYKGIKWDKHLGRGGQGKVKLVQNLSTGDWHALKIFEQGTLKLFEAEHKTLMKLGKAKKTMIVRKKDEKWIKRQIIMDYERGKNFASFMSDEKSKINNLSPFRWFDIILQMLQLVKELHANGLLHCDIKPENFLYDIVSNKVKLIDYGIAMEKNNKNQVEINFLMGTQGFIAPELYKSSKQHIYNEATEVYALGCTFQQILDVYVGYMSGNIQNKNIFYNNKTMANFLKAMCHQNPQQRPSIDDAIKFFNNIKNSLLPLARTTVGLVNLSEYQQAAHQSHFIKALQCMDSVILIDDKANYKEDNDLLRASISRSLLLEGVVVQEKMIIVPRVEQMISQIPAYLEREEKRPNGDVVNYFYFSEQEQIQNEEDLRKKGVRKIAVSHANKEKYKDEMSLSFQVTSEQVDSILLILQKELDRITKKYDLLSKKADKNQDDDFTIHTAKNRATAIMETQNKLKEYIKSQPKLLTYEILYKELDNLQEKMLPTKKFVRYFGVMFEQKKSEGKKIINKAKVNIQKSRRQLDS